MRNHVDKHAHNIRYTHIKAIKHRNMTQEPETKYWGVTTLPSLQEFRPQNLSKQLRIPIPHV